MKNVGDVLPLIKGVVDIQAALDRGSTLFVILTDKADRHDIEATLQVMQDLGIRGIVALESCVREVREMSPGDMESIRDVLDDALVARKGDKAHKPLPVSRVDAERVLAALKKRPGLYEAVRAAIIEEDG